MKMTTLVPIINFAFKYVIKFSRIYNIDESHALKHSMETFRLANEIYNNEVKNNPYLEEQQDVIYVSSILHDMCDKKYMVERLGVSLINQYMGEYISQPKLDVVSNIITTMSYSKVKQNGYPNLEKYQLAYHIVRESDLLAAYDIDRCIMFGMSVEKLTYSDAMIRAIELFDKRVLKYRDDGLFVTDLAKEISAKLHEKTLQDIQQLQIMHSLSTF
jgi:HD superfamily phosphodiesterase